MTYKVIGQDVCRLFASVAPKYDLVNSVLSFGIHHYWRFRALRMFSPKNSGVVLDLCTGTGALVPALVRRFKEVVAADFCKPMLEKGKERYRSSTWADRVHWTEADAMSLPFEDAAFDAVTVAFGVRNFEDLARGLSEIKRVLKPQGRLVVLEFGQPDLPVWRGIYQFYSRWILPRVGGWLSGDPAAYKYLPETSANFPCGEDFSRYLTAAGLLPVRHLSMTGGVCHAYAAVRP